MDANNDKMSLITFNHNTEKIFGSLKKEDIEKKYLNSIDQIIENGGTDLVGALKASMANFETEDNIEKRIIMITDAEYWDNNNALFDLFKKCAEEKGISITIIAISE